MSESTKVTTPVGRRSRTARLSRSARRRHGRYWCLHDQQCTSRTEIPHAHEAIVERPGRGDQLRLAQQHDQDGPMRMRSMWQLYVNTDDCDGLHAAAVAAGHPSLVAPVRLDRWPVTIAVVGDPDGYLVELVQRHAG